MASIHISKEDAVRDIAALMEQVSRGAEVIIDAPEGTAILMRTAQEEDLSEEGHDAWFRTKVNEAVNSRRPHASLREMHAAGERLLASVSPPSGNTQR